MAPALMRLQCLLTESLIKRTFNSSAVCLRNQQQRRPKQAGSGGPSTEASSKRLAYLEEKGAAARTNWLAAKERQAKMQAFQAPKLISELSSQVEHDDDDDNFECAPDLHQRQPVFVYFADQFAEKKWRLESAVDAIREAADPAMFNCLDNPLKAKLTLNMRTKKTTKFKQSYEANLILPHKLSFLRPRRLIAICKDASQIDACLAAGAVDAGSEDLLNRIASGAIHSEEYDEVVCITDHSPSLKRVRNILGPRLPTVKNGKIGDDVIELIHKFKDAISLESKPVLGIKEINELTITLGLLSWDYVKLSDNLKAYCQILIESASKRVVGDCIESVEIFCPPIDERFLLKKNQFAIQEESTAKAKKTFQTVDEKNAFHPAAERDSLKLQLEPVINAG